MCDDESVLGVHFYVMRYLDGDVVTTALPPGLETPEARRRLAFDLVDTLVEIHAADVSTPAARRLRTPRELPRATGRRFTQLWEINRTRPIPAVERGRPRARRSAAGAASLDRGARGLPAREHDGLGPTIRRRIAAVLDWEMGAIGDPRADLGYLARDLHRTRRSDRVRSARSPVTGEPGFPSRHELVDRYCERTGRDVEPLAWFEALALWKAAVFCEAIYGRFTRGELGAEDTRAALLRARRAAACRDGTRGAQALASATARSVATSRVETSRLVAPDSRHAANRSRDPLLRPDRARPHRRTRRAPPRPPRAASRRGTAPGSRAPPPRSRTGRRGRCRSSSTSRAHAADVERVVLLERHRAPTRRRR